MIAPAARAGLLVLLLCGSCVHFQRGPSQPVPPEERLVVPGRGQVRVIDTGGPGKVLLLVHGYGATSASYGPVVPELRQHFRVLAIDLPGFGKSDRLPGDYSPAALADVLAQVLDQKGVRRVHLMGHSWGGAIALAFALRHSDRLDRLVVVSGWIYDDQKLPLMRWATVPGLGELLYAWVYPEVRERLYLNFYDPSLITQAVVDDVERGVRVEGSVAAALQAARGMRFRDDEYRTVTVPTLLLWGSEDRVSRPFFAERLLRELPHGRLVVLPQCGHIPMWECGRPAQAAMLDFLLEAE